MAWKRAFGVRGTTAERGTSRIRYESELSLADLPEGGESQRPPIARRAYVH